MNFFLLSFSLISVPRMPKVLVKENPISVLIEIPEISQDCDSLRNDMGWHIAKSRSSEVCLIEKENLQKHVYYNLTLWRQVDVWNSEKESITFRLQQGIFYILYYSDSIM